MYLLIISYSYTGNNALLAKGLAVKLDSDYSELREMKKRNVFTIFLDVVFNRTPKTQQLHKSIKNYDYVIFVAPIWFGKIATPFRHLFKIHKEDLKNYAFISLSAGANGDTPNVEAELQKYIDKKPKALVHLLITDLVPYNQRANRKLLDAYRLNEKDAENLINNTAFAIEKSITTYEL